jgi:hypothetical protein
MGGGRGGGAGGSELGRGEDDGLDTRGCGEAMGRGLGLGGQVVGSDGGLG